MMNKTLKKRYNNRKMAQSYIIKEHDDTQYDSPDMGRCMCLDFKEGVNIDPITRCKNRVAPGYHFCPNHINCPERLKKYINDTEPEYRPDLWNQRHIQGSHNCYAYFLDSKIQAVTEQCISKCKASKNSECPLNESECTDLKPQPGDYALLKLKGNTHEDEPKYKCDDMEKKILNDNKFIIPVPFSQKCPPNYFKGAMVVDPDSTFHFYRQDKGGLWSHKPGISPVTNIDASNRPIYIPHIADRNYARNRDKNDAINYSDFCGYYCIPNNYYMEKHLA